MRLIDADAFYETAKNIWDHADSEDFEKEIFIAIATAPTIDAVPVVRCKDCKYWERDAIFNEGWCRGKRQDNSDWFCADGERREDD